jgi:hypothetical protein
VRKILAVLLGLTFAASAQGATLKASVAVTPKRAGTVARPAGVKLAIRVHIDHEDGVDAPIVTDLEVWHGPGLAFDRGKGYVECPLATLKLSGPGRCPAEAILGRGSGPGIEDPVEAAPKFVIVNAPGRVPVAYTTLQRPARVRAPVIPTVFDNPHSIWPHRTTWRFPESLRVVAGIPITMGDISIVYGFNRAHA